MDAEIRAKFDTYPSEVRQYLKDLRALILRVATEYDLGSVDESLKWGELSYSVKGGSPIRTGWRENSPDNCYVFFNCQSSLIECFREIFGDTFGYEGKRAIVLDRTQAVPTQELAQCISLAMRYHKLKHLTLLGA